MTDLRQAAQMALAALERYQVKRQDFDKFADEITALRTALEQPMHKLRRGDILRCMESNALCTVWSTSTTGWTLVKWAANDFGNYTAEQIGELFWIEQQAEPVAWTTMPEAADWCFVSGSKDPNGKLEGKWFPLYTTPPQQQAEPVMANGLTEAETSASRSVVGLTKQAEPVAWDKPSDNFNAWWDSYRHDGGNPFQTDSFAYWAFAGWQAALAQRPWQGLTEEEIAVIGDKVANEDLVVLLSNFRVRLARAIEQTLKEKNHD